MGIISAPNNAYPVPGTEDAPVPEVLFTYKFVRRDTGPQIKLTLHSEDTELPEDISRATVTLHVSREDTGAFMFTRPCFVNPETGANGVAIIAWEEGDLDIPEGFYLGELEIVLENGIRETLFDVLRFYVREDRG